jgi:hypothetical protein
MIILVQAKFLILENLKCTRNAALCGVVSSVFDPDNFLLISYFPILGRVVIKFIEVDNEEL